MIVGALIVEACSGSGGQRQNRHLLLPVTCEKRHAAATLGIAFRTPSREKKRLEQQAEKLSPGPAKDQLLHKIDQIETVSRMDKWLSSRLAVAKVTSDGGPPEPRNVFAGTASQDSVTQSSSGNWEPTVCRAPAEGPGRPPREGSL
jgi:hypothetical protein